jgi:hypothetical protein
LSASTNALGYFYPPYSTLSLNNPSYTHQSQYNLSTNSNLQYLPNENYQHQQQQQQQQPTQHHHSMINLNHSHIAPKEASNLEPLAADCPSPTMSNSPIPVPPAPPLNPSCARCRFTSSFSATSNGTIHRQPNVVVGSNPHIHANLSHQNSVQSYGVPPAAGNVYTGEFRF